ncbi:GntR family transcriptional regulator [Pacificoceanicola onchidii]|uniref:GntR family transcriptional regulator n=1 Tax=Pacificoceanicola onchidii TaxID=2562685 RepID=UPI0010A47DF0|nr:GntR family transcriptional regulator [Pacificoceanicola onchidii]
MNIQAEKNTGAGLPVHEKVYRRVRDMVLFGDMVPGQAVTINGLVEQTGAGMTPVREALRRLTAEGALAALGNRRIVVPELSAAAVSELTSARLALEPLLAHRAVTSVTEADIARLTRIDDALDEAITRGDIGAYLKENYQFHDVLNGLAGAPIITAMVEGLWLRFGPSLRVVCGQLGTRNLPDRHKELLEALARRDAEAAAHAIEEDVAQGMELVARGIAGGAD